MPTIRRQLAFTKENDLVTTWLCIPKSFVDQMSQGTIHGVQLGKHDFGFNNRARTGMQGVQQYSTYSRGPNIGNIQTTVQRSNGLGNGLLGRLAGYGDYGFPNANVGGLVNEVTDAVGNLLGDVGQVVGGTPSNAIGNIQTAQRSNGLGNRMLGGLGGYGDYGFPNANVGGLVNEVTDAVGNLLGDVGQVVGGTPSNAIGNIQTVQRSNGLGNRMLGELGGFGGYGFPNPSVGGLVNGVTNVVGNLLGDVGQVVGGTPSNAIGNPNAGHGLQNIGYGQNVGGLVNRVTGVAGNLLSGVGGVVGRSPLNDIQNIGNGQNVGDLVSALTGTSAVSDSISSLGTAVGGSSPAASAVSRTNASGMAETPVESF